MTVPTLYNQISANRTKTFLLMGGFSIFIVLTTFILVFALGYEGAELYGFVGIFLIISTIINIGSYFWSDKVVLGMSGAKKISKAENPKLFNLVENLCIATGTPIPGIYVSEDESPNAFATGRDPKHAVIVFTSGLLKKLDNLELEGVAAHELSHIRNYDIRLMTIIVILVGMIALLVDIFLRSLWFGGSDRNKKGGGLLLIFGLLVAVLAPIISQIIKFSISRQREFLADSSGALITRNPESLATALIKISQDTNPVKFANNANAHLFFDNPFKKVQKGSWMSGLFSTHPSVEDRVNALRQSVGSSTL